MKNFDSRTYSINDFLEWHDKKQLVLSPKFQRRAVWSENAKSYLMDTILRGKPIPKVFIRQKLNVEMKPYHFCSLIGFSDSLKNREKC